MFHLSRPVLHATRHSITQEEELRCTREGSSVVMEDALARRDAELETLRQSESRLRMQLATATESRGWTSVVSKMQFEMTVRAQLILGPISALLCMHPTLKSK
jgi:hypothetical protein